MADPDLELRRGPGYNLLAQWAFLPLAISSFFCLAKRGARATGPIQTGFYLHTNWLFYTVIKLIEATKDIRFPLSMKIRRGKGSLRVQLYYYQKPIKQAFHGLENV